MKTTYIVLLNKKWHTYTIFYFLFNLLNDFIYKLEETVLIDWKIILNRLQEKKYTLNYSCTLQNEEGQTNHQKSTKEGVKITPTYSLIEPDQI